MSDRFLHLILYFIAGLAALLFVVAISIIILRGPQEAGRDEARRAGGELGQAAELS
jgi:hypothetical protein